MAAPSLKIFSVGMNAARIYALTSAGYPAATNATVYDGVNVGGPITFSMDIPDPDVIAHPGNNAILQTDVLASTSPSTGRLVVSREDAATHALLSGTKVHVISDFNVIGWHTSQQGLEPTVGMIAYDQAKDEAGNRVWRTHMIGRAVILPKMKGMSRERGDIEYTVQPQITTKYLTGLAFTANDDGYTTADVVTFTSAHRLHVAAWVTTATEVDYVFNVAYPKYITGAPGIMVYKNGVAMTYGVTADTTHFVATTTKVTFGAALTNTDVITAIYEVADSAVMID
jgi:hypothetical protein